MLQPCQSFSPVLKEFYGHVSDQIEIVYISSDKTVPEFESYFGKMPWLSMPMKGSAAIKQQLAHACHITGIPSLIVLHRATGHYITNQARTDVAKWNSSSSSSSSGTAKESAKAVVEEWMAQEAVPLSEAKFDTSGPGGIMGLVQTMAQNPVYIIGLFYIFKVRSYPPPPSFHGILFTCVCNLDVCYTRSCDSS
jgi:nucleoredoxin